MTSTGYSDRINHALAFAAKHHDQEVRKGTRLLPYFTTPANVAVILTRYGQDDETVVAGILRDVVEDYLRDGFSPDAVRQRLADKFGDDTVTTGLGAARRRIDVDGIEMWHEEQKARGATGAGGSPPRTRSTTSAPSSPTSAAPPSPTPSGAASPRGARRASGGTASSTTGSPPPGSPARSCAS